MTELLLGLETADDTAAQAMALQPAAEHLRVLAQPRSVVAMDYLGWLGRLHEARDELVDLLVRAGELGDESSPPYLLAHLALVECDLGHLEDARRRAAEGREASEQSGQSAILAVNAAVEALVEAQRGREAEARGAAGRAFALAGKTGARQAQLIAAHALGHLENALGRPREAARHLEPVLEFVLAEGIVEPGAARFVLEHVEALVELGRTREAEQALGWYEGHARRLGRASALACCARCRGLLAAQAGALEEAVALFGEALGWHARVEVPLERGRTLLALGAVLRRARRRREARETLSQALALFEGLGAAVWAERARGELRRISGRAPRPHALTPAEERVAALVAEGRTNREVAAALFLSERTVEGHLSRVFAKLGVRHRAELGRALASGQRQGSAPSNTGGSPVSSGTAAS